MRAQEAVVCRMIELIEGRGITINKLANLSAIPSSTLKNIMNGKSNNTGIVTIAKICDGLEITVQYFFSSPIFSNLEQEIQ